MKKKIISIVVSLCLILTTFFLLQNLLVPKYVSEVPEGSLIAEYYREETFDHQVIFVGDCEVYENFSPITLWEEYGIKSYIRGSAEQTIWQSYYLMEDSIRKEKPDVFVYNVLSMKDEDAASEAYNRLNLDGMEWSQSKWNAIHASMTEDESIIDYIFPILRYHQRWSELTSEDFQYMFGGKPQLSHNGFLMRVDEWPVTSIPDATPLSNYQFSEKCYEYLDKMVELCQDNDVKLILIKAPSLYPAWYDQWDQQMVNYAKEKGIDYVNFLDLLDEVGLDFEHDTYDGGLHLNLSGAEKLSTYFGQYLKDHYSLEDGRDDHASLVRWQQKVDFYNDMKADQYRELEEYGYLKSYGAKKR